MSRTLANYFTEQTESFLDVPLTDVDSLALSTIAYFCFEHGVLGRATPGTCLPLPVALCGISRDRIFTAGWFREVGGDAFLTALLQSPRYMELQVGGYANEVSSHLEKQFSAVTFILPDGAAYIAFRGTDCTLVGWKEDFNLSFMSEVPSQARALAWLEDVSAQGFERIYVGGHSKGGNLAEYAALTCSDATFDKIVRVFSHDGPGFANPPSERFTSAAYQEKLRKTVPGSSIFGMLMESRSSFEVVRADGVLFRQHAPTNWVVEDGSLVRLESLSPEAVIIDDVLNNWSRSYDAEERELLIDTVFDLINVTDVQTWAEFGRDGASNALTVMEEAAKLPPEMRSKLLGMLRDITPFVRDAMARQAKLQQ